MQNVGVEGAGRKLIERKHNVEVGLQWEGVRGMK